MPATNPRVEEAKRVIRRHVASSADSDRVVERLREIYHVK